MRTVGHYFSNLSIVNYFLKVQVAPKPFTCPIKSMYQFLTVFDWSLTLSAIQFIKNFEMNSSKKKNPGSPGLLCEILIIDSGKSEIF